MYYKKVKYNASITENSFHFTSISVLFKICFQQIIHLVLITQCKLNLNLHYIYCMLIYIVIYIIYMCIYNIYVYIHHVPKGMSCNKAIVAITGRLHCFRDCIYIYIYMYIYMIWYSCIIFIKKNARYEEHQYNIEVKR